MDWSYLSLPEHTIKQEEETEDERDRRTTAEDMGQSGEEESGLEEPMIDSPNNLQDGVPGSDGSCDPGTRLPNGKCFSKVVTPYVPFTVYGPNLMYFILINNDSILSDVSKDCQRFTINI